MSNSEFWDSLDCIEMLSSVYTRFSPAQHRERGVDFKVLGMTKKLEINYFPLSKDTRSIFKSLKRPGGFLTHCILYTESYFYSPKVQGDFNFLRYRGIFGLSLVLGVFLTLLRYREFFDSLEGSASFSIS